VTGLDLESYFREHIFDPLGMKDTTFLLRNDMAQRLVGTHVRGLDGKPAAINLEIVEGREFHTGGAGLFSTAPDYITFTRMLLAGGTLNGVEVLKQETVKLMACNAIGDLDGPIVRSNNPALALEVETFPGQVKKWGLTFLINTEEVEGFRGAGSLTWGGVHNTYYWIDLKNGVTAVALTQILPMGDPHVQEMMIGFERAVYAAGDVRPI
jgi:methyl acetate hydrolase